MKKLKGLHRGEQKEADEGLSENQRRKREEDSYESELQHRLCGITARGRSHRRR